MTSTEMEAAQARVAELKQQLAEAEAAVVTLKVAEEAEAKAAAAARAAAARAAVAARDLTPPVELPASSRCASTHSTRRMSVATHPLTRALAPSCPALHCTLAPAQVMALSASMPPPSTVVCGMKAAPLPSPSLCCAGGVLNARFLGFRLLHCAVVKPCLLYRHLVDPSV
jgi:hypothetical protein